MGSKRPTLWYNRNRPNGNDPYHKPDNQINFCLSPSEIIADFKAIRNNGLSASEKRDLAKLRRCEIRLERITARKNELFKRFEHLLQYGLHDSVSPSFSFVQYKRNMEAVHDEMQSVVTDMARFGVERFKVLVALKEIPDIDSEVPDAAGSTNNQINQLVGS